MNKSYSSYSDQYNYLSNAYDKKYSKQYGKFTSGLDFSSDFNLQSNKSLVDIFSRNIANQQYYEFLPIEKAKRGALDRVFAPLSIGKYVSAGFVQGMVDEDLTPFQGVVQGVIASNPFGEINEDYRHNYSRVLETAGWQPETGGGKFVRGATGFALDILLDPLTYVGGGFKEVVKGTGKHGAKATVKFADKFDDGAELLLQAGDIVKNKGITQELAEKVVKNSKLFKSGEYTIDVVKEGTRFMEKYNKLIGINAGGRDVTLSLANAPLGKKIFGKYAEKSLTLFDSETVKAFGDATIAPFYSKLRDGIFGSKIGELFAPNHPIFKYSKHKPDEVFNFFKSQDFKNAIGTGKHEAEKAIRAFAKNTLDASPAEQKMIIDSMQDKTIMHKVNKVMRFSETKEAMLHKQKLEAGRKITKETLDDVLINYEILEEAIANSGEKADVIRSQIDTLQKQKAMELLTINNTHARDLGLLEEAISQYEKMSETFNPNQGKKLGEIAKNWELGKAEVSAKTFKDFDIKSVEDMSEHMFGSRYVIGEQASDKLHSILNSLTNQGNATVDTDAVDELMKLAKNNNIEDISPDSIKQYLGVFKSGDKATVYRNTIDDVSTSLFGKKGMISYSTGDTELNTLFKMAKDGESQEALVNYVFDNKKLFSGQAREQWEFIAKNTGYGGEKGNWREFYEKPLEVLAESYKKNGKFTPEELHELAQLKQYELKRNLLINEFKGSNSLSESKKIIGEFNGVMESRSVEEIRDSIHKAIQRGATDEEIIRGTIAQEMGMGKHDGGAHRAYQKVKEYATDVKLSPKERDIIKDHFTNKYGRVTVKPSIEGKTLEQVNEFIKETAKEIDNNTLLIRENQKALKLIDEDIKYMLSNRSASSLNDESFVAHIAEQNAIKKEFNRKIKLYTNRNKKLHELPTHNLTKTVEIPSVTFSKRMDKYVDGVEKLLQEQGRNFGDIDLDAREEIYNIAEWLDHTKSGNKNDTYADLNEHIKNLGKAKSTPTKFGKEIVDGVVKPKVFNKLDDITNHTELFDNFVKDTIDFSDEIGELIDNMASQELITSSTIKDVTNYFDDMITKLESTHMALEDELSQLVKNMNDSNPSAYTAELATKVKAYDDLLDNTNKFETYVRSFYDGDEFKKFDYMNSQVGNYVLDKDNTLSPESKKIVENLREQFIQMAEAEIDMGKLTRGQLDANKFDYLPHILTKEGEELFANKEMISKIPQFGQDLGYGREFNPHSMSRTIKFIPDSQGGFIDKPTIEQLNKYFKDLTGVKQVFSEDLSEIYLARAIKHNDLMYDNKYMEDMLNIFGDKFDGTLKDGHIAGMNYGMLKKTTSQVTRGHVALDISDAVSDYLSENEIFKLAEDEAHRLIENQRNVGVVGEALEFKKVKNDIISRYVSEFMENSLTQEVRDAMYETRLNEFLTINNTYGALDEMALPITSLDIEQAKSLTSSVDGYKNRLFDNIRKKVAGVAGVKDVENSPFRDMSIDDLSGFLSDAIDVADDVDASRLQRIVNQIDKYNKVVDPEVRQIHTAIAEKANLTRQLQITRDSNSLLSMYDKFTHFMKLQQTVILPGFHARNKQSNMFSNYMAIGQDAINIDFQKRAYASLTGAESAASDMLDIIGKDGTKSKISWSDLLIEAENFGAVDKDVFAKEIGATSNTKGLFRKFLPGKYDPTDTGNFIGYKVGTKVGNTIENHDRLIHFASQVSNGMDFQEAAESVNKFLFDYGNLTYFEQNVMKRIFPYYTWLRKNSELQLNLMLEKPEAFRNIGKIMHGIEGMVDEDQRINKSYVSKFAQDWVQTPFNVTNPDGREEPVLWNPNLPFMDIGRIPDITQPMESLKELFGQTNPMIKLPIELAQNRNHFFDSPIAYEGDNRLSKSIKHVAGQMGIVPLVEGLVKKQGVDFGLHVLNNTTGVKLLSYDYEKFKQQRILELRREGWKNEKLKKQITGFAKGIMEGINGAISMAISSVGSAAYENRPTRPDEYTGALRPISEETFNKLSKEEQALYTPPSGQEAMYYNNKAIELEQVALQETGEVKKYIWAMLEDKGIGKRNEEYDFGHVTHIVDGDTFKINLNNKEETVRILLVDTPETEKVDFDGNIISEAMPYADEAMEFARDSLFEKDVKLIFDGIGKDKYGRLLAYVEVDGVDFNEQILEEGMGQRGYAIEPNYQRSASYKRAEKRSHSQGKGLWSIEGYASPNGNAFFNTDYNGAEYNGFKQKKFREILDKKDSVKTNRNPFDDILRNLK